MFVLGQLLRPPLARWLIAPEQADGGGEPEVAGQHLLGQLPNAKDLSANARGADLGLDAANNAG